MLNVISTINIIDQIWVWSIFISKFVVSCDNFNVFIISDDDEVTGLSNEVGYSVGLDVGDNVDDNFNSNVDDGVCDTVFMNNAGDNVGDNVGDSDAVGV